MNKQHNAERAVASSVPVNARHLSGTPEHYTPAHVIEAARATLGEIDLDPASCAAANQVVRATRYYAQADNGFLKPWAGRVFLNPPGGACDRYGRQVIKKTKTSAPCTKTGACGLPVPHKHKGVGSSQKKWWQELVFNWSAGAVTAGVFVCFSLDLFQTTQVDPQGPLPLEFPFCCPSRRLAFTRPDGDVGDHPTHTNAIICVSHDLATVDRFRKAFSPLGYVVVPTR